MCDGSGMNPIVGPRFHKIATDYDLCAREFEKLPAEHQAAFEVIRFPGAHPIAMSAEWLGHRGGHRGGQRVPRWAANVAVPRGDVLPEAPLEFGRFGPGVAQLQQFLIERGMMSPDAIHHRAGLFGPQTAQAVNRVRASLGLAAADGTFDLETRASLLHPGMMTRTQFCALAKASKPAPPPPDLETELSDAEVAEPEVAEPDAGVTTVADTAAEPVAAPVVTAEDPAWARWGQELAVLDSMGFEQNEDLIKLLDRAQGSLNIVISQLLPQ